MSDQRKALVFLYEPDQIDRVLSYTKEKLDKIDCTLISLDYEIDLMLAKKGVPFSSLSEYVWRNDLIAKTNMIAEHTRSWYNSPDLAFFSHGGISLGRVLEYSLSEYLYRIFYYIDIFKAIIQAHPDVHEYYIPESGTVVLDTAGQLANFEVAAAIDTLKVIAEQAGSRVTVLSLEKVTLAKRSAKLFMRKIARLLVLFGISSLNKLISVVVRPKPIKIYVSDYWWHIDSFVLKMPDVEVVMMERKELQNATRFLFKKRVRFHHPGEFLNRDLKKRARDAQQTLIRQWQSLGNTPQFAETFVYNDVHFWPIVRPAFEHLVTSFALKMLETIEGVKNLYRVLSINQVILRASVSGQTHFAILGLVAKELGIPSVELQHGLEFMAPYAMSAKKNAEYLASYGPLVSRRFVELGNDWTKTIDIGSPRFDYYLDTPPTEQEKNDMCTTLGIDRSRPVLLCIIPDLPLGQTFTTYDVKDIFKTLDNVLAANPDAQVILKLRPGRYRQEFYNMAAAKAFRNNVTIAQYENLQILFAVSDVVVSCYSTVILEAMIAEKPVVLYGLQANDRFMMEAFFASVGSEAETTIARTEADIVRVVTAMLKSEAVRREAVERVKKYIKANYCFDGQSASRMARFLHSLSHD